MQLLKRANLKAKPADYARYIIAIDAYGDELDGAQVVASPDDFELLAEAGDVTQVYQKS